MTRSAKTGRDFVYFVPLPPVSRNIALTFAAIILLMFAILPIRLGIKRTCESLQDDLLLWLLLLAVFAPCIGWMIRLAFPSRRSLARLEFGNKTIRFVPKRILRWIGEPSVEAPILPNLQEIVLCPGTREYPHNGFTVLLRQSNGTSHEVNVPTGSLLNARESEILTQGIGQTTGLPVRLVQRKRGRGGAIEETAWVPAARSPNPSVFAGLILAATPLIGGTLVGFMGLSPAIAAGAGIALWLVMTLVALAIENRFPSKKKFPTLLWLTTLVTFAAVYAVAFVVTNFLTRGQ